MSTVLYVVPTTGDDTRAATRASGGQYLAAVPTEWASLANDALAHDQPETAALCLGLLTDTLSKAARNEQRATISWQFTIDDARRKLHRLYPS